MKTMNNINNTTVTVGNITMSPTAYEEFYELRIAIEQNKQFSCWDYNPYFLIVLYDYYKTKGNGMLTTKVKNIIKNLDWFFDDNNLYVYPSDKQYKVTIRKHKGEDCSDKIYTGNRAFEVIRDMCLPVVLNYK